VLHGSPSISDISANVTDDDMLWIYTSENWKPGNNIKTHVHLSCDACDQSYNITKWVDAGSYGSIYFGKCVQTGSSVVFKIFRQPMRPPTKQHGHGKEDYLSFDFPKEYCISRYLRKLAEANTIPRDIVLHHTDAFYIRGDGVGPMYGCIVMPRYDGSVQDLFHLIDDERLPPTNLALSYLYIAIRTGLFICETLRYLHEVDVFHLDIKPANVLYRLDDVNKSADFKLIDFGLSCMPSGDPPIQCCKTGSYVPPEWQKSSRNSEPTFQRTSDRNELISGEKYAVYRSMKTMLKRVHRVLPKDWLAIEANLRAFADVYAMLEMGCSDVMAVRDCVSISGLMRPLATLHALFLNTTLYETIKTFKSEY